MLAYQFQATTENGFIRIPDEYKTKIGAKIRVTIVNDDELDIDWDKRFPPMVDTSIWKINSEEANERYNVPHTKSFGELPDIFLNPIIVDNFKMHSREELNER